MGLPMAHNLIATGRHLTAISRNAAAAHNLHVNSVAPAGETEELVDAIITMLPDGPDVEEVALSPAGIPRGAPKGLAYIDTSSNAPAVVGESGAVRKPLV